MITAQAIVRQVEITQNKTIRVLISKEVANADVVVSSENHPTTIQPLSSVESHMAVVNNDLVKMGYAPISNDDIASIRALADAAWDGYVVPEPPVIE
jgi:hypothetical protein